MVIFLLILEIINPQTMKILSESQIKEIAGQMDCGMRCYHNTKTNKLLFFPVELDFEDEDNAEFWQEDIEELENEATNYLEVEKPESHDSFSMMQEFANSTSLDTKFQDKLITVLEMRKPFANFKTCIDNSDYREDWFRFKSNWMQKWVKDQLKMNLEE